MADKKKQRKGFLTSTAVMGMLIIGTILFIVNRALNKGKGIN